MTTLNLTLPNSIQRHLQEMADLDGVPIDQFIMSAVAEKISALTAETYLRTRMQGAIPVKLLEQGFRSEVLKLLVAEHAIGERLSASMLGWRHSGFFVHKIQ